MPGCAPMASGKLDACHFCHRTEEDTAAGTILKLDDNSVIAHVKCMQFSPKVVTTDSLNENILGGFDVDSVKNEKKRGARTRCTSCGKTGGTIGCDVHSCKKTYHYLCIKAENGKCVEDSKTQKFLAYCVAHKPESANINDSEQEDDTNSADSTRPQNDKRPTPATTKRKKNYQKTESPRAKKRKGPQPKKVQSRNTIQLNDNDQSEVDIESSPEQSSTASGKKKYERQKTVSSRAKQKKGPQPKKVQSRTTIQLNGDDQSEEEIQSLPEQFSTASDENSELSGISRIESSGSETDDGLCPFDGCKITPNTKKSKNVSTPKLKSSDGMTELPVDENADSSQSDASEQSVSLLNPIPKLLHSTSLSKTWKKNATADEREILDSAAPEVTEVFGTMYEELGGSLPQNMGELSEADVIGNDGDLNMDDMSSPQERPVSEHTSPLSESSISSQPTSKAQNGNSTTGKERMEPELTNGAYATPTKLRSLTKSGTKSDGHNKVHPLMNKSPLLDKGIQQKFRNLVPKIQSLVNKGRSFSNPEKEDGLTVQVTAGESTSESVFPCRFFTNNPNYRSSSHNIPGCLGADLKTANSAENPEEGEDVSGMANMDVSISSSTETTEGIEQLAREYKEISTQTDAAYPETDVSSINFSSSENADLFTQYKTVKELMSRPQVESSESGQCKKFWDMCHEKDCLSLYLENIKCSLKLITQNILKGAAAEHEYEQAFRFLMGSRYVEGLALKEREVIQHRISHIEDEKQLLARNLTMLDDLLI